MQRRFTAALIAMVAAFNGGCDDGTGLDFQPLLVTDTVVVAAPLPENAELPTALDITSDGFAVSGGRFPEFPRDALEWDFMVRIEDGELVLIPAGAVGVPQSRAAITPPIEGETFESLRETPGQATFSDRTAATMLEGRVYAARSRHLTRCGGSQFAKLEPLDVNVAEGLVRLQIVTNSRCGDARLVPLD